MGDGQGMIGDDRYINELIIPLMLILRGKVWSLAILEERA